MEINKNRAYRKLIVGLDTKVPSANGKKVNYINFDNAATTPPFKAVMKKICEFAPMYSSVHRGEGYKSNYSSELFDSTRSEILKFFNADEKSNIVIFVKNTTEGLNKLSYRLINDKDCVVLSSAMEHHSNDLPWRDKCKVDYVEVDSDGRLLISDLQKKLEYYNGKVKYVTISGASNVTGYVNNIYRIAEMAHSFNSKIIVDGAQLVPHAKIDLKPDNDIQHIDYIVFSAHKMYAPFGIGVIIGPKEPFSLGDPEYKGGGTIKTVTMDLVDWAEPPYKEEAGSQNIIGVAALSAAIKQLNKIGMAEIEKCEKEILKYALESLSEIKGIEIYGETKFMGSRLGIIPFNIKGIHHSKTAKILSEEAGISVRSGCFCAQPYVRKFLKLSPMEIQKNRGLEFDEKSGMVRLSFGLYNTKQEIDILVHTIRHIIMNKSKYQI
ncbi:aminotransferase class V-fold PLP-dependent enzyme [Clostridium oryzae]|uniref:aminotransferase class V-fold PLP-dependent enzyme n=1 Tax=Clostridium oryzae TaxID=1450648 RepID=UPI003BFA7612